MTRVNVFFSDQLLDEIDRQAREEEITRSALIQVALEKYIEAKRRGREDGERRKKMQDASCRMDALAKRLGNWDPQAPIRKSRDRNLRGSW